MGHLHKNKIELSAIFGTAVAISPCTPQNILKNIYEKTCFYVIKKKLQYKNPTGKFVYHNIIYYFFVTGVPLFISRAG